MDSKMGLLIGIVIIVVLGVGFLFFLNSSTPPVAPTPPIQPPVPLNPAELKTAFNSALALASDGTYEYIFSYIGISSTPNYAPTELKSKSQIKLVRENGEILMVKSVPLESSAVSDSNGETNPFFPVLDIVKSLVSGTDSFYNINNQKILCLQVGPGKTIPCRLAVESPSNFFSSVQSGLMKEADFDHFSESKITRMDNRECTLYSSAFSKNTNPYLERLQNDFNAQIAPNPQSINFERTIEQKICIDTTLNEVIWYNLKISYTSPTVSTTEFDAKLSHYSPAVAAPSNDFPYPFLLTGSVCNLDTNTTELSLLPFVSGAKDVNMTFNDALAFLGLTSFTMDSTIESKTFERLQSISIPLALPVNQTIPRERLSVNVCMEEYCQSIGACPIPIAKPADRVTIIPTKEEFAIGEIPSFILSNDSSVPIYHGQCNELMLYKIYDDIILPLEEGDVTSSWGCDAAIRPSQTLAPGEKITKTYPVGMAKNLLMNGRFSYQLCNNTTCSLQYAFIPQFSVR